VRRITRDKTIPSSRRCSARTPAAEVELGETFVVETINFRTPIVRTAEDANPEVYREREETGPIFVRGIQAGEVLHIHIDDIRPEGHASGVKATQDGPNSFLPIKDARVLFPGGLWAEKRMMIGEIYTVAKDWSEAPRQGGNMDFKDVCAGNSVLLRTAFDGGLLVLGDLHAAQGDGELAGCGAECAGEVTLRIERDTRIRPAWPLVLKERSFVSICTHVDYAEAAKLAIAEASAVLSRIAGVGIHEARLFVETVGDLRNGAVWGLVQPEPSWGKPPLTVGLEVQVPEACW
jgi:amidase